MISDFVVPGGNGYMASVKTLRRMRLTKKCGLIGLIVTSMFLIIVIIVAILPKGNDAFTIRILDSERGQDDVESHYTMSNSKDGKHTSRYLRGEPAGDSHTAAAFEIEEYLAKTAASEKGLEGSQNYIVNEDEDGKVKTYSKAVVYTVYLQNASETESQIVKYGVDLDGYKFPNNDGTTRPIDYFRILIQTSVEGEDKVQNVYYGQATSDIYGVSALGNNREPIYVDIKSPHKQDEDGNTILSSDYQSEGNDGYCVSFNDFTVTNHLIDGSNKIADDAPSAAEVEIPAGKMLRFTFAGFYETGDVDCFRSVAPEDSYLLFSLYFGI